MTLNYRASLSRLNLISLLSSVFNPVSWGLNLTAIFSVKSQRESGAGGWR